MKVKKFKKNFELVESKLKEIEEKDHVRNFQPPISGDEIMTYFNLTPCAVIGEIKNQIKEAVLEGKIGNNYDEAFQYMLEIANKFDLTSVKEE